MKNLLLLKIDADTALIYVGGLVLAVFLIYILREGICWYYKINIRTALMKKQIILLEQLIQLQGGVPKVIDENDIDVE